MSSPKEYAQQAGSPVFDIAAWRSILDVHECSLDTIALCSPCQVLAIEQYRAQRLSLGRRIPTDVFVMAKGEPANRAVTKAGGLPYRPSNAEWPRHASGPFAFLGQLRFTESRDLLPVSTGDVLLVFCSPRFEDPDAFYFEWQNLGLRDLARSVPETPWIRTACFGYRYRTFDFLADHPQNSKEIETNREVWLGFKIGGVPVEGHIATIASLNPGRFVLLGSMTSLVPVSDAPYPWINVPEPMPFSESIEPNNCLYALDGFAVQIWFDGETSQIFGEYINL